MATILDMVRVMQQMEEAVKRAYGFTDLHAQLARAAEQAFRLRDTQARIAKATEQFRTVDDVLRNARVQMQMRDDQIRARTGAISALAAPALDVSRSITKMLERFSADRQLADITAKATKDWSEILRTSEVMHQRAFLPVEAHLARLYEFSAISEASLLRVRPEALGSRLGLDGPDQAELIVSHHEFGTEYRTFFDNVSKDESTVIELPIPLTELPAAEFVNQAALVVSTSDVEADDATAEAEREVTVALAAETSDHLTSLIAGLNQDLVLLLQGARAAVSSRHPDYIRHFTTSLRELFTQVLHTLSPEDRVGEWTKNPQHYHNKRPTRKARLLYITRNISPIFGGFINADVDAVLEFIDAFQKGTHGVRPTFTEDEIRNMSGRMEGLLRMLLVIQQIQ